VMMTRNISIWTQLEFDNSDRKIDKHALYFKIFIPKYSFNTSAIK